MRAARIENGKVVDLWEVPSLDCYGDLYTLVAAPDDVVIGAEYDGAAFTNPPLPPESVKAAKIAQINKQRDDAFAAGFKFNERIYPADHVFQLQVQAFVLAFTTGILPADAQVSVRLKDNTIVQVNKTEITQIATGLMQYVQGVYATSWAAKDALS